MSASHYIANLQPDEIAAPELAIDREIEEDEVSHIAVKFKSGPDRLDLPHFQRRLLPRQLARIQPAMPCLPRACGRVLQFVFHDVPPVQAAAQRDGRAGGMQLAWRGRSKASMGT